MKNKAIVINIIGGPGCGKSIITSELFAKVKRDYIKCDMVLEYYKDILRQQATKAVANQIKVFGNQQFRVFVMDEVDVVITDSPILLPTIYDKTKCPFLKGLAIKEFNSYNNLVYYIERDINFAYEQDGRYQDLAGAKKVDEIVKDFLIENNIQYKSVYGIGEDTLNLIFNDIKKALNER